MKLYFAKSESSIKSIPTFLARARTCPNCSLPARDGAYDFFTNSIAAITASALALDYLSYPRKTESKWPISWPWFFAVMIVFPKNATSLRPKFRPYPARGWTPWAASPRRAMRCPTRSFAWLKDKGKAYLFVWSPLTRGGCSKSNLLTKSGRTLSGTAPSSGALEGPLRA